MVNREHFIKGSSTDLETGIYAKKMRRHRWTLGRKNKGHSKIYILNTSLWIVMKNG